MAQTIGDTTRHDSDSTKYTYECTPKKLQEVINLATRNKVSVRELYITYNIPSSDAQYFSLGAEPDLYRSRRNYALSYNLGCYDWSINQVPVIFNSSDNLPLYKWYANDITLNYSTSAKTYNYIYNWGYACSLPYNNTSATNPTIINDGTSTKNYKNYNIYADYDYETAKGVVPNRNTTFVYKVDYWTGNAGSMVIKHTDSYLYAKDTGEELASVKKYNSYYNQTPSSEQRYPSASTFKVAKSYYLIDSRRFNNNDIGIYVMTGFDVAPGENYGNDTYLGTSGSSPHFWEIGSGDGMFDYGMRLIFYPDGNKWRYINLAYGNSGTCDYWLIGWGNSLNVSDKTRCPFLKRLTINFS